MKKLIPLLIVLFALSAYSQGPADLPIIGDISQIRGMTKIYIAGATSDDRKFVLMAFKKEQKNIPFVIVGDPAEAEIFMNFGELTRQVVATMGRGAYQERDELEVYFFNKDKKKVIVFTDTETLDRTTGINFTAPNSFNLTRNFFKAYNKKPK